MDEISPKIHIQMNFYLLHPFDDTIEIEVQGNDNRGS